MAKAKISVDQKRRFTAYVFDWMLVTSILIMIGTNFLCHTQITNDLNSLLKSLDEFILLIIGALIMLGGPTLIFYLSKICFKKSKQLGMLSYFFVVILLSFLLLFLIVAFSEGDPIANLLGYFNKSMLIIIAMLLAMIASYYLLNVDILTITPPLIIAILVSLAAIYLLKWNAWLACIIAGLSMIVIILNIKFFQDTKNYRPFDKIGQD